MQQNLQFDHHGDALRPRTIQQHLCWTRTADRHGGDLGDLVGDLPLKRTTVTFNVWLIYG